VANNFVKDGLTTWTPSILNSLYSTPAWLSILLTLLLPLLAICGAMVAIRLQRRTNDFIASCTVLFLVSALLIGVVMGFLSTSAILVTIVCFALVSCLMAGVNNVITSMVPLYMKDKMNSGKLAGILNGFCYLGSTISSYGLGAVADARGWTAVFTVLLIVACAVALLGLGALLHARLHKRKTDPTA
jgi:OPA family glycerol-3-phosphate transporter-like MFS transporter